MVEVKFYSKLFEKITSRYFKDIETADYFIKNVLSVNALVVAIHAAGVCLI